MEKLCINMYSLQGLQLSGKNVRYRKVYIYTTTCVRKRRYDIYIYYILTRYILIYTLIK